jgi:lysophospholipase L1-like esterase
MISRFLTAPALALAILTAPAFAASDHYTYLALGDSIAFGYDPTVQNPKPNKFTGYPEIVAQVEQHLVKNTKEENAACPGQSSASFLDPSVGDIGCVGFKDTIGLHTNYSGSQMDFAVAQVSGDPSINLVTLSIGGNDLLLVEQECGDPTASSFAGCVQGKLGLPPGLGVLKTYGDNLATILTTLRMHYGGKIVLVKYYAPSADPLVIEAISALNSVMVQVGTDPHFNAKFADAFTAFQIASALYHGDPCKAGLVIRLSATTCDVHPTPAGRDLIAATVVLANLAR